MPYGEYQDTSTPKTSLRSHVTGIGSSHINKFGDSCKPLPPLPLRFHRNNEDTENPVRPVLSSKTTNIKLPSNPVKEVEKLKISKSVSQDTDTKRSATATATGGWASADTANLNGKISGLMQQAAGSESRSHAKEQDVIATEESPRLSALQRGKQALTNAKQAIVERLASPAFKSRSIKYKPVETVAGPENNSECQSDKGNSGSRKAKFKGVTGTDSKIALVGERIRRKPLPVYESMKSRRETPEDQSNPDPFSDNTELEDTRSSQNSSDFDFDFDLLAKKRSNQFQHSFSHSPSIDVTFDPARERMFAIPKSHSEFSNTISGLRQHPIARSFSGNPASFSTPRVRLGPLSDTQGKKRLSAVLLRDPSMLDFSFELERSSGRETDPLLQSNHPSFQSPSMKRKSATEDLRTVIAPTSKRVRKHKIAAKEELAVSPKFHLPDKHEDCGEDGLSVDMSVVSHKPTSKRFGIVDFEKSQPAERALSEAPGSPKAKERGHQRTSSIPRPTSVLFSRESRARVPLLKSFTENEMKKDELHTEDGGVVSAVRKE